MTGQTYLWQADTLRIQSGNKTLLSLDTVRLPDHKISCVIGPNGAGKSTLIKALMMSFSAKEQSQQGDILYKGLPVQQQIELGQIAWVGQHERYELPLTVLDYVLLGRCRHLSWYEHAKSSDIDEAMQYLEDFELSDFAHKRIQYLSGGEKQRASIVRAFMQNTDCLMMDEPTNHLDIKHQYRLMNYLQERVHQRNTGIVLVLHDLNYAYYFCQHVVILKNGLLVAEGDPKDIMTSDLLTAVYEWPIYIEETGIRCGSHMDLSLK